MTHESQHPRPAFSEHYPMPNDQIAFEMDVVDSYAQQFPDQTSLMNEGLNEVKRFSGFNIPKYRLPLGDTDEHGLTDELGYLTSREGEPPIFAYLTLQMPKDYTAEEISRMTESEKSEAMITGSGIYVIGDIPPATHALLENLYGLVGAKVVRDQRTEGQSRGIVIRTGVYQGTQVYLQEEYDDHSAQRNGKPTLAVKLVEPELGEQAINELNNAELKDFIERSGVNRFEARDIMREAGINRHNYREAADVLKQTREIVDAAGKTMVPEALADTIDNIFEEMGIRVEGVAGYPKMDVQKLIKTLPKIELDKNNNLIIKPGKNKISSVAHKIGRALRGSRPRE